MRGFRRAGALLLAVTAALVAVGAPAATAATSAAPRTGQVYVLQGIPGESPSVTLDGRVVARDVGTKTVVGPLAVGPGAHTVQLWRGDKPVAQASFSADAGSSTSMVAHLFPDAQQAPAFTTYRNDTSPVPAGRTRLLVAHTAVAPPADIVVDGRTLISNLANGEFATNVVPAGSYQVSVVPTATAGPAILGPTKLSVGAGKLVNVFAIGNPGTGSMDAIVQELNVGATASATPSRVDSGNGGQAADLFPENRGPGRTAILLAVAAVTGYGLLSIALQARRRTS